ncbi:tail fiber protein [Serratia ureilytica]|uniref:tail fiber protein n=1 Tax=Serratia ureilytica TaxID=300181 RepID=UPI0018D63B4B|nr:tail fiber protein [Serratia ureilytica]MBH2647830.1 tail fiber protein [Serratia ureilytica]
MTDKTPKNTAETAVNTLATLAKTTDTARAGELKSRALPQADALKARFKAGSIPLQTDFADLIDLANMGRQAVGGAEGQTGPANGFTLSSMGRLELKPNTNKGISVDQDGLAVKVGKGIKANNDGIYVPLGWGLRYGGDGLDVICKTNGGLDVSKDGVWVTPGKGITVDTGGVGVKAGNGVALNSSGVNIKLAKGVNNNGGGGNGTDGAISGRAGGLSLDVNGLSIDAGDGIQLNQQGVSVKLGTNSGLSADEKNGLQIVPEQKFQKGMIMMFAGTESEMPKGWALCDGTKGTPNLIDRFILGSTLSDSNEFNDQSLAGNGSSKYHKKESSQEIVSGTLDIDETVLSEEQIPPHSHIGGMPFYNAKGAIFDSEKLSQTTSVNDTGDSFYITNDFHGRAPFTSATGGGKGHAHKGTINGNAHGHTTDVIPPYYTLAFIIKL